HRRSYLSVRPDIRLTRRRTDAIRLQKSHQPVDRAGSICLSAPTSRGKCKRIAGHCAHYSNRPEPAKVEQRRTSAHSSVRGKTNAKAAGGAPDFAWKTVGHFEDKYRRISRRYWLLAESYSRAGLFVFSS